VTLPNPYDPLAFMKAANAKSKDRRASGLELTSMMGSMGSAVPGGSGLVVPMSSSPAAPTPAGKWVLPVNSKSVTSPYGNRTDPLNGQSRFHTGTDFGAKMGQPVYAVTNGVVRTATPNGGAYGNQVILDLGGGLQGMYGHLSRFTVRPGQRVRKGQVIGYVGSTGRSTGPHLHFETTYRGKTVNPQRYL
jgi:murein DD-endopeptidase MepM/ murein hydrolase activator NlpD